MNSEPLKSHSAAGENDFNVFIVRSEDYFEAFVAESRNER
jgi:hypothetical protein